MSHVTTDFRPSLEESIGERGVVAWVQVARDEGEMIGVLVRAQVQGSGLTQVGFSLLLGRIRGTGRESRGRRKGERGEEGGREGAVAFAVTNETLLVL